jgi:5'-deoxynucleotidase
VCLSEVSGRGAAGNPEFAHAEKTFHIRIESFTLPEVRYFLETFVPSFGLTLDELQE